MARPERSRCHRGGRSKRNNRTHRACDRCGAWWRRLRSTAVHVPLTAVVRYRPVTSNTCSVSKAFEARAHYLRARVGEPHNHTLLPRLRGWKASCSWVVNASAVRFNCWSAPKRVYQSAGAAEAVRMLPRRFFAFSIKTGITAGAVRLRPRRRFAERKLWRCNSRAAPSRGWIGSAMLRGLKMAVCCGERLSKRLPTRKLHCAVFHSFCDNSEVVPFLSEVVRAESALCPPNRDCIPRPPLIGEGRRTGASKSGYTVRRARRCEAFCAVSHHACSLFAVSSGSERCFRLFRENPTRGFHRRQ